MTITITRTVRYKGGDVLRRGQEFDAVRDTNPAMIAMVGSGWTIEGPTTGHRLHVGTDAAAEIETVTMYRHRDGLVWMAGS